MYISNLNLFPELQIHISNCQLDIFTCMFNRPMPNQNALRISVSCPDGIQRLDLTTTTSSTPILYNQQNKVWEMIFFGHWTTESVNSDPEGRKMNSGSYGQNSLLCRESFWAKERGKGT